MTILPIIRIFNGKVCILIISFSVFQTYIIILPIRVEEEEIG